MISAPPVFVIVDRDGEPLRSFEGQLILLASRHEAASWLLPGERVKRAAAGDLARDPLRGRAP